MTKLFPILFALVATAACSGRGTSCPDVVDHAAKVMKMDLTDAKRSDAVARCEKAPAATRECIRKADSPSELAACDTKE